MVYGCIFALQLPDDDPDELPSCRHIGFIEVNVGILLPKSPNFRP